MNEKVNRLKIFLICCRGFRGQTPAVLCTEAIGLERCTAAVYRGASGVFILAASKQNPVKSKNAAQPRTSVTFPPELYKTLEEIAKKKKVSLAWIVREAAERYVADQWPLFGASLLGEKR